LIAASDEVVEQIKLWMLEQIEELETEEHPALRMKGGSLMP
jgi:hypothetical protein